MAAKNGAYTLIDESYNANPASMRAAIMLTRSLPLPAKGRRIAVLGDMLELGEKAAAMHAELAADLVANDIDLVFAAGPLTRHLYDALPRHMQGAARERAGELAPSIVAAIRAGDIVLVKGSNAIKMRAIIDVLKEYSLACGQAG